MEQEIKDLPAVRQGNTPRDLFLHLLAIVTLYWSAISFTTLLWQFINYYFPDVLNYYSYQSTAISSLIRFSVSALIIIFPVFLLVSKYLNKVYAREAAVRESKIRKWLIYLTLFIASLVIIGDLVSTINTLLGGEITARFVLKALSVLLVAGIVFGYYLDDVRKESPTKLAKPFAWVTGVLVLAAIINAFFIVGTPNFTRLIQFDQQKVSDLQSIQSQIVNYWQKKGALPNSLADLEDPISGYKIPIDQQNSASREYRYEYYIKNLSAQAGAVNLSFELCATFNAPSQKTSPQPLYAVPAGIAQNWDHSAGRVCFERTIDKQLYPVGKQ